ncbi:hypothetical protein HK096_001249 [Nowakowskiella sp. JEL0078]|nr:hypothetical protein HK096_001249 [Nowakowskiella sp. JEL0078]
MSNIIDNYALNISDRLALYRKVRQESALEASFLKNFYRFTMSSTNPKGYMNEPKVSNSILRHYNKYIKSKIIKKEKTPLSDQGEFPGLATVNRPKTPIKDPESANSQLRNENLKTDSPRSGKMKISRSSYDSINEKPDVVGVNEFYDSDSEGDDDMNVQERGAVGFTNAYLQSLEEEAELNETGLIPFPVHHFDRRFAAGLVTPLGFMHSLVCQTYFRPYIIDVVKLLSTSIIAVPVHPLMEGKRYIEVMQYMLKQGFVVMAVFRNVRKRSSLGVTDTQGNNLPYVYTNPLGIETLSTDDDLFVIPSSIMQGAIQD